MKSRYNIRYSLSALELSAIIKSLKEHRKIEIMKPYGIFIKMWQICFIGAGIAAFILFLNAIILSLKVDDISDVIIRLKNMNIGAFILLAASLVGAGVTEKLEQFIMKKKEHYNQEYVRHIKINRHYIENIQLFGSTKVFWSFIKKAYINKEFMFIQTNDNEYIVFPARSLASEEEFQQLFMFITEQINNHSK
ncbi:YcxB family protein [Xenorhabdus sp. 18]|uniref:YcxB family protein n=1 Tax=Xenorhabdus doucetiae TaxID=351671 RepID=UPI0019A675F1|nr:YcxB family protein [Xenorhabdus sp. 18]MBD2795715.1 YcxB family protein [Xenorhabdus sp. 18]